MSDTDELTALDRTTLRFWRASNLLGWSAIGAVAAVVTFALMARTLLVFGIQPMITFAIFAMCVIAAGVVDGVVVGNHVYRSPGWAAALGVLVAATPLLVVIAVGGPVEILIELAIPIATAVVAAIVARNRFRRRPRAMRLPSAR